MAGPDGGLPDPGCAAFDFDSDTDVDVFDFSGFQGAFTGPPPCTPGHKYTGVSKSASGATGALAIITTHAPTLCGEFVSEQSLTSSLAFVGVTKFLGQTPQMWGQTGFERFRDPAIPFIVIRRYAETKWGPGPNDVNMQFEDVGSGAHIYDCHLITSLLGTWSYNYDELQWTTFTHNNWQGVTGTHYQFETEIFHQEDDMVGNEINKCHFTGCSYGVNWGGAQFANLNPGDLNTDDPTEWAIEYVNDTDFNVWDLNLAP